MFAWLKKQHNIWLILANVMIVPGIFLCRWLTENMLASDNPCIWTLLGGQCITCGGTHFVNDLSNFRILTAWEDNPFLFILTVFLLISVIALDLWLLAGVDFCKKLLKVMYNIPSLILWIVAALLFLILRNIPVWILVWNTLQQSLCQ